MSESISWVEEACQEMTKSLAGEKLGSGRTRWTS